jgi:hypothetical protein
MGDSPEIAPLRITRSAVLLLLLETIIRSEFSIFPSINDCRWSPILKIYAFLIVSILPLK